MENEVHNNIKMKNASKAGRPSITDGNKRDAITLAAIELFAANGFENTTVDDIALKAGVAKGTVYYHFESKDRLLLELVEQGFQTLAARIKSVTDANSSINKRLEGLISEHCRFMLDNASLCQVTLAEVVSNSERCKHMEKLLQQHIEFMGEILGNENISEQRLNLVNIVIFGAVSVATVHFIKHHSDTDWPSFVNDLADLLVQGMTSLMVDN